MTPSPRELLPLAVRFAVREAVGGWGPYKVREIYELFAVHGFSETSGPYDQSGGERRSQAEAFHAAIDWTSPAEVERYLRVVEDILEVLNQDVADFEQRRARLTRALERAGIRSDANGRLSLPPAAMTTLDLTTLTSESDIRFHLARLERLDQEPEEMIGAAKDLVEATAKHVLLEFGETPERNADVATLSKQALTKLNLHAGTVAPTAKGAEIMVRMLGGLAQVAIGLPELRNLGYGVGHGQGRRLAGIKKRHAEFAARAAAAYVAMVLDTLHDPDAPWRDKL